MQTTSPRETLKPLADILSYENDRVLARYSADYGVSLDDAKRSFEALKGFMVICAVKPGPKVTSDPIDKMWHTFLLFTREYKVFCEEYLGRFIDHEPFEVPAPSIYLDTRLFAQQFLGAIDEDLWPVETKTSCSSGCGD